MSDTKFFGSERRVVTRFVAVYHGTTRVTVSVHDVDDVVTVNLNRSEARALAADLLRRADQLADEGNEEGGPQQ